MTDAGPKWPPPERLTHGDVTLSRFDVADAAELFAVLDHDEVWRHVAGRPSSAQECARTLTSAPDTGRHPWVVRDRSRIVGTTSFLDVSPHDLRLEIGHTAYAPDVWGSGVNPAAKAALLEWAFTAGFTRVQLKTDVRNLPSCRAIAGLGAREEGILRRYQRRADGSIRDTVMFSVLAEEWPGVRDRLRARLGRS